MAMKYSSSDLCMHICLNMKSAKTCRPERAEMQNVCGSMKLQA